MWQSTEKEFLSFIPSLVKEVIASYVFFAYVFVFILSHIIIEDFNEIAIGVEII